MDTTCMYRLLWQNSASKKEKQILKEARLKELNVRLEQFNISGIFIIEKRVQLVSLCQELHDMSEWETWERIN